MIINEFGYKENSLMKTVLSFLSVIVCLIFLFLLVPMAGAEETEAAESQETEAAESQEAEADESQEAEANEDQEADADEDQEADAADTQEPSEENIAAEKERLEAKIAELEAKPLEYFGSQKNKHTRIGFYKYRLETLEQDPDKYFAEPEKFEGNLKTQE